MQMHPSIPHYFAHIQKHLLYSNGRHKKTFVNFILAVFVVIVVEHHIYRYSKTDRYVKVWLFIIDMSRFHLSRSLIHLQAVGCYGIRNMLARRAK